MTETEIEGLIRAHAAALQKKYTALMLTDCSPSGGVIQGMLRFTASYDGIEDVIDGAYQVDIQIPRLYPDRLPTAKEVEEKIEKSFHTNPDGTLCLGAPLAVMKAFSECPNLVGFVEKCLIPFFFSYEYKKKHGFLPFGELSHGAEGILEHYRELFRCDDDLATLGLLRILADSDYRGHYGCPCGKRARLRQCHGDQIKELFEYQSQNEYLNDYAQVMFAINRKRIQIPKAAFSKTMAKYLNVAELLRKGIIG